ncbi:MAG: hypothetical protein WCL42_10835 [Chlorobiaceae bacterium]
MKYFLFEDTSDGEAASSWCLAESSGKQWPPTRPDEMGKRSLVTSIRAVALLSDRGA